MKYVVVLTENYVSGGLDTFLIHLLSGLSRNHRLEFMCNQSHPGFGRIHKKLQQRVETTPYSFFSNSLIYRGMEESLFTQSRFRGKLLSLIRKIVAYPWFVMQVLIWAKTFRRHAGQELLIVNGGYPGGLVCRAAAIGWWLAKRKKAITNIHNLYTRPPNYRLPVETVIDYMVAKASKKIITVSHAARESLRTVPAFRFCQKNIEVIYNGSMVPSGEVLGRHRSIPFEKRSHITVLAAYEERKGYLDLLKALHILKKQGCNVPLRSFGYIHTDHYAFLKAKVVEFGLEEDVELNSFVDNIDQIFETTRVLIVPSKSFESFGLVAVEAFFRHIPVIAYSTGGLVEVVDEAVGKLVETGDVCGLANAIKALYVDEGEWKSLSVEASSYAAVKFSLEQMISQYEALLHS